MMVVRICDIEWWARSREKDGGCYDKPFSIYGTRLAGLLRYRDRLAKERNVDGPRRYRHSTSSLNCRPGHVFNGLPIGAYWLLSSTLFAQPYGIEALGIASAGTSGLLCFLAVCEISFDGFVFATCYISTMHSCYVN